MKGIWKWIQHNRFTVIIPSIILLFWVVIFGCSPRTPSPLRPGVMLTSSGLATEFEVWQITQQGVMISFEAAGKDLDEQRVRNSQFFALLLELASGSVANWPGLLQLFVGSGLLAAVGDNIRKGVVISKQKKELAANGNHTDTN